MLAGLTGSASGGMTIALDALGDTYLRLSTEYGIDHAVLHRLATISAGTLDALPHNGTVLTALQVSRLTHGESYFCMLMIVIVSTIVASVAVIVLGSVFGSFCRQRSYLRARSRRVDRLDLPGTCDLSPHVLPSEPRDPSRSRSTSQGA
jgi:Mg2+/citrate symporter